jgi:hypothetical protein
MEPLMVKNLGWYPIDGLNEGLLALPDVHFRDVRHHHLGGHPLAVRDTVYPIPRDSLSNSAKQSIQFRETVYPIPRDSLSNSAKQSIQFRKTVYPIPRDCLVHIPGDIFSLRGLLPPWTVTTTYGLCCAAWSLTNSEFNHGRKCLCLVFYCDTKGSDCLDKCAAN